MKTVLDMIQLTIMDLFVSIGVGVLLLGWGAILYAKMATKLARLEKAVDELKEQVAANRREDLSDSHETASRVELMALDVAAMRAMIRENTELVRSILAKHEDRLNQYDQSIKRFWEEYDIRKKKQ